MMARHPNPLIVAAVLCMQDQPTYANVNLTAGLKMVTDGNLSDWAILLASRMSEVEQRAVETHLIGMEVAMLGHA